MSVSRNLTGNKRFRAGNIVDASILHKISQQVSELQMSFSERVGILENKLDLLVSCYTEMMEKMESDQMHCNIKSEIMASDLDIKEHDCCRETLIKLANIENMLERITDVNTTEECQKPPVKVMEESNPSFLTVLLPQTKPRVEAQLSLDSSMQVITLNSESDFPDGSWLGDENNPEARVRVPISPAQLLHINTHCKTPGKMAIVLVDYLFPKEVLATSNLSGKGRHCKKQLDPLMVYGIRSHLLYKFDITEKEWYRIKQNIDSKCRTAWRKKIRGILLGENKNPMLSSSYSSSKTENDTTNRPYILSGPLVSEEVVEEGESGVVRTNRGHFKIVRATPEQMAKLQESHTVKVFTNEDMAEIFSPSQMFSVEDMDSYTLTGCGDEHTLTIVTENGEVNIPVLSAEDSLESDSQFMSTDP